MPIEFATLKVKVKDLLNEPELGRHIYHAPYIPVHQHGYGRMDKSTPGKGLSTSRVVSCTAVVLHSSTTGRTILSHSPNYLYMNTFVPIVDWITGGSGSGLEYWNHRLSLWYEGLDARPCEIEVIVMRGSDYASPRAATYGHEAWMRDLRRFFWGFSERRKIRVSITDAPSLLTAGAVMVDKISARITYLEFGDRVVRGGRNTIVNSNFISIENPSLTADQAYSQLQQSQDLFVGSLLITQRKCPPLYLQYDVTHYCLPIPLPEEGRLLLRSKMLGEPPASQKAILKGLGLPSDWISLPRSMSLDPDTIALSTFHIFATRPPCELCGKAGDKRCSACMGAWYCGPEHQKTDWSTHKSWCKAHRLTK